MALLVEEPCMRCGSIKLLNAADGICSECRSFERHEEHREHFEKIDQMTLEERVREIEEWIFEFEHTSRSSPLKNFL